MSGTIIKIAGAATRMTLAKHAYHRSGARQ
jgi:hypothetical protein